MTKRIYTAVLFCSATVWAQQPAVSDLASSIKTKYNQNKGFIVGSAESMPADAYGWRPTGLEAELRTFGQMLVHIANENNQQCGRASGQQGPATFDDAKAAYTKDQATKILKDSFALCDPVFNSINIQSLSEMVKIPGRNNSTSQRPRGALLINDLTHSNEQYGMIMVYFAVKGMVPVSHEK